jgi:hypothetical protein
MPLKMVKKQKVTVKTPSTKAKAIEELHAEDRKLRYDLAVDLANHGQTDRVHFAPGTSTVLSLGNANDINAEKFDRLMKKAKDKSLIKWHIQQVTRQRAKVNGVLGEYLKINASATCPDFNGNEQEWTYDLGGPLNHPVWETKAASYDAATGEETGGKITFLHAFKDVWTIKYSKEQFQILKSCFDDNTHFQINANNRKLTCTAEEFTQDLTATANALTPAVRMADGRYKLADGSVSS